MLLKDWLLENTPSEDLLWKDGFWNQVNFVRSDIAGMLMSGTRLDSDTCFAKYSSLVQVVGTHRSKSVTLPVYLIEWENFRFTMRHNFFDWKVSVVAPYPLNIDFEDIFEDAPIASCYFEGMSEVYSSYQQDKSKFSVSLSDTYALYFFFRKIWYSIRTKEKEKISMVDILEGILPLIPEDHIYGAIYYKTFKNDICLLIEEEKKSNSKIYSWNRLDTILSLNIGRNSPDKNVATKLNIYKHVFQELPQWLKEYQ